MRHGPRLLLRQVQKQRAAQRDIELLQAEADPQHRQPPVEDQAHQQPVALVAPLGHRLNGRVRRQAVTARVKVEAAAQQDAVEPIEQRVEIEVLT